jgi:hypothetical protein
LPKPHAPKRNNHYKHMSYFVKQAGIPIQQPPTPQRNKPSIDSLTLQACDERFGPDPEHVLYSVVPKREYRSSEQQ